MAGPELVDVAVIGGGPAGLAAAAEAKGAGAGRVVMNTLLFTRPV